jgi:ATP/maltotriose-dependent transcriptional regulator MalT
MAWTSAITGDFDGAIRWASVSLAEFRGQDEPLWTGVALVSLGSVETAVGRHDDALRHLTEMRDLAERFDNTRLITASRVQLGTLAMTRGRAKEARALLDEGLDLSVATNSIRNVTLCLAALAELAFEDGGPRAGGAAGRGRRGPAAAGRAAGLADRPAWPGRAGRPGPPGAGR